MSPDTAGDPGGAHVCPEEIIIKVVTETVPEYVDVHASPERTLGNMVVYEECLRKVREEYPCNGATTNMNGQVVCPLAAIAQAVKSLVTAPHPPQNYALDVGKVGGKAGEERQEPLESAALITSPPLYGPTTYM